MLHNFHSLGCILFRIAIRPICTRVRSTWHLSINKGVGGDSTLEPACTTINNSQTQADKHRPRKKSIESSLLVCGSGLLITISWYRGLLVEFYCYTLFIGFGITKRRKRKAVDLIDLASMSRHQQQLIPASSRAC